MVDNDGRFISSNAKLERFFDAAQNYLIAKYGNDFTCVNPHAMVDLFFAQPMIVDFPNEQDPSKVKMFLDGQPISVLWAVFGQNIKLEEQYRRGLITPFELVMTAYRMDVTEE